MPAQPVGVQEVLDGFSMLAERALADVIRGPTNTSRLRLAPCHPYAPVGYTTYAHIDPVKAALRAGSYQWESEKIRFMIG